MKKSSFSPIWWWQPLDWNVTNKEQSLVRKTTEIKAITYTDLNRKQILTNTVNFNYSKFVTALKNMTYSLDI